MSEHLIAIALGPVQEFIQAGRKTRDLWFGSYMLSEIAKAAARELQNHGELIFPASKSLEQGRPAPNKLLARLDADKAPEEVAGAVHRAANARLDRYRDDLTGTYGHLLDTGLVEAQVAGFLEFYAAWFPIPETSPDNRMTPYAYARGKVEALIAGRKAIRNFAPPPQATVAHPSITRSALDPSRISVVLISRDESVNELRRSALRLRGKEELDAISLVKRTAIPARDDDEQADRGDERFVSTARVAIDPFIRRLVTERDSRLQSLNTVAGKLKGVVAERFSTSGKLAHFHAFPWDIQAFWDPGVSSADLAGFAGDPKTAEDDASEFHELAQSAMRTHEGIVEMPAYYAIVQADGDRMGKLIGQLKEAAYHERFSFHSATFSNEVTNLAIEHKGALVYSGGDDVLAFLPLDKALDFARAIRKEWSDTMRRLADDPELVNISADVKKHLPTLSAGIAIVHYGEHLQRALGWARDQEQAAKRAGRDRLAIAYYPRGSGTATASSIRPWDTTGGWQTLIDLHRDNDLPDGAGYELRELAARFKGLSPQIPGGMLGLERDRILRRKRGQQGQTPLSRDALKVLGIGTPTNRRDLDRLAAEIIISRLFAKAIDTAEGLTPKAKGEQPKVEEGAA
jgi:CRISPR-associated protein Cmr2